MKKQNRTKKALVMSVVAMILCVAMLAGTTFAWFTDSASNTGNKIEAGTLDVKLYMYSDADNDYIDISKNNSPIFGSGSIAQDNNSQTLWEPGKTQVAYLMIENAGDLDLKYNVALNVTDVAEGLYQVMEYMIVPDADNDKLVSAWDEALGNNVIKGKQTVTTDVELEKGAKHYFALVIHMMESAGNEYKQGEVSFDLTVNAAQLASEEDVFGNQYDADATYPPIAWKDATEINAIIKNGKETDSSITKVIVGTFAKYEDDVAGVKGNPLDDESTVMLYHVPNPTTYAATTTQTYTLYMLSNEAVTLPENSTGLFQGLKAMTEFDGSNLDMSQVKNAKSMFQDCSNLTTIEGAGNWDMSNVENALAMFANCSNLETLDVTNWDVSNMTTMQSIFYGCNKLNDIDVSNWDTSNVTNMRMVFFRCYAADNNTLKGVENWDVSNVTNFYSMFKHARGMTSLDLTKWDTSNAINMSHLFANIGGVEELDLSSFNTANVTDMSWMFYDASQLKTIYIGDGWVTSALDPTKPTCFYNNQSLVGGNGTTWLDVCDMANDKRPWESSAKLIYAIADGGTENPGLLTYKAAE